MNINNFVATCAITVRAVAASIIAALVCFWSVQAVASEVYPNWQIADDLSNSITYEYSENNSNYLYVRPDYVQSSDLNELDNIEGFYKKVLSLSRNQVPKPTLVPVGVNGLPIFVPVYRPAKRMGDAYVQRMFILDQIRRQLGARVIDQATYGSEAEQINYLYDSALRFADDHKLMFGSALPVSSWRDLHYGDIIWPELREINGEYVLVPVVYLSEATIKNFKKSNSVTIVEGDQTVLTSLNIGSSSIMEVRSAYFNVINNLNVEDGGTLYVSESNKQVIVGGALDIFGGNITAEDSLQVVADSIQLRPTVKVQRTRFGEREVIGSISTINAEQGHIVFQSYNHLTALAAEINAGNGEITLAANGDIEIAGQPLTTNESGYRLVGDSSRTEIEYISSKVSAKDAVRLIAGGSIRVSASDLVSDEGIVELLAQTGVYIENEFGVVQEQMHYRIGDTTSDISQLQTFAIQANLKAGRGVHINTEVGPIVLRATDIQTQDGVELNATNGDVHLLMAVEHDQYNYSSITESLLTIQTEVESWDRDTEVYTTIVGGLEINATRGLIVEYGGVEDEDGEPASTSAQLDALRGKVGFEWLDLLEQTYQDCSIVHGSQWTSELDYDQRTALTTAQPCIDYDFIHLMDEYSYDKSTSLSPAAMAVISIAVAAVSGGIVPPGTLETAMVSAATSTLATQAIFATTNSLLNGGDLYDAWKELGSKENIRQLATSIATAGAMHYASDVMNLEGIGTFTAGADEGSLNLLGQTTQIVANSTVRAGIEVLAQGGSLSDFGDDFAVAFENSLKQSVVNTIGEKTATFIGSQTDLNKVVRYAMHAASGCIVHSALAENSEDAELKCYSGGAGAVIGEAVAESLKPDSIKEFEEWFVKQITDGKTLSNEEYLPYYMALMAHDVDLARLSAGLAAFLLKGDVEVAATSAGIAAQFNNHSNSGTEAERAVVRAVESLQYGKREVYKIVYEDGRVAYAPHCVGCLGLRGDELALTPEEELLKKKTEEYVAAKRLWYMECWGRFGEPGCVFTPPQGTSDEAIERGEQLVEEEIRGIDLVLAQIRRNQQGTEALFELCVELGPCLLYDMSGKIYAGSISASEVAVVLVISAGGYALKYKDEITGAFKAVWTPNSRKHLHGEFNEHASGILHSGMHTKQGLDELVEIANKNGRHYDIVTVERFAAGINTSETIYRQELHNKVVRVHLPRSSYGGKVKNVELTDENGIKVRGVKTLWPEHYKESDVRDAIQAILNQNRDILNTSGNTFKGVYKGIKATLYRDPVTKVVDSCYPDWIQ